MSRSLPSYEELEPRAVWREFAAMCRVPRPSKDEDRIQAHLRAVCEGHGWPVDRDEIGNLVVRVPAAPGREAAPTVVLQAHVDMVCEKGPDSKHDFSKDPIRTIVDRDEDDGLIVRADGTTLGADNGIGVCLALAAAMDEDLHRPALELLFTVDEEEGMSGAENLDGSLVRGRRLVNLDTEDDNTLYIGCAGGCDSNLSLELPREAAEGPRRKVVISGLRGGHSGADIHEGRGCAVRLLARVLDRVPESRIVEISGGSKRNAIARDATATVIADPEALAAAAAAVEEEGRAESKEPKLRIEVVEETSSEDGAPALDPALDIESSRRLIHLLLALPHGVVGMHPDIPLLVETSNNLATLKSSGAGDRLRIEIGTLSRSSSASRMEEVLRQIESVARLADAEISRANAYPGWQPDMDSPLLGLCRRVHREVFGSDPIVEAVHAGLECGLLGRRIPGLDMVSLGPRIEGPHSPHERVWVKSVQDSWTYLRAVLEALAETEAAA